MIRNFKSIVVAALVEGVAMVAFGEVEWQAVESSWLERVGYDRETGTLSVQMQNSSDVYEYHGVPEAVYRELLDAESKGAYFATNIQNHFETVRH